MKTRFAATKALGLLSLLLCASMPVAHAGLIPLNQPWNPAPFPNRAPPFYVYQNDPGLTEYLYPNGTTGLCVPAAIANTMIYQYAFKENRVSDLKIPGLSADQNSIDSNTAIRYFSTLCKADRNWGTSLDDAARCMAEFYRDSGYSNSEVRVIRRMVHIDDPNVTTENRVPTLSDLQTALDQGYEVLASVVFMQFNRTSKLWVKTSGHTFNVYGMAGDEIYLSNPTRAYNVNSVDPIFDVATIKPQDASYRDPIPYSSLKITGRLLNKPNQTTFLAGLTLIKANQK